MHAGIHIGHELWEQVESHLKPGETVLWADQPIPRFFTLFTVVNLVVGLAWSVGFIWFISPDWQSLTVPNSSGWDKTIIILISLFFLSLGLQFILMPVKHYQKALSSIYILSDKRAIHVKLGRKLKHDSYPFNTITQIRLIEKPDSPGNVIMVSGVRHEGLPPPFGGDPGFYHIKRAAEVAGIFVELLTADSTTRLETTPLLITVPPTLWDGKYWLTLFLKTVVPIAAVAVILGVPAGFGWLTNTSWAGFLFTLFLFLLLGQIQTMRLADQALKWPCVEGTITESYVHSDEDGNRSRISYRYQVGDKAYENNVVSYNPKVIVQADKPTETVVARYPEGGPVTVYHHPRKPGHAVLERGSGNGNWIAFVLLFGCLLASTIWMTTSWEGVDRLTLETKWQQAKQYVGFEEIPVVK